MPEPQLNIESKKILGKILAKAFETEEDTSFDELLKKCNSIPNSRETVLQSANDRLEKLLNTPANTQFND